MNDLLRDRTFRTIFVAQNTSLAGDWMFVLVLGVWVMDLTRSTAMASGVVLAMAAPRLLAPLGGPLVDRMSRRRCLVVVDLACAPAAAVLLTVDGSDDVWKVYTAAAVISLLQAVGGAAMTALVQSAVPPGDLGAANAVLQTTRQGWRLVGPLLGVAVYGLAGPHVVVVLNSASFLLSASLLAAVRESPVQRGPHAALTYVREAREGAAHLLDNPVLRVLLVSTAVTAGALGLMEAFVFEVVSVGLHRPATFLGVLLTVQGAGAIARGVLAMWLAKRTSAPKLVTLSMGVAAAGVSMMTLPSALLVATGALLLGLALPLLGVGSTTTLQLRTPHTVMGRVASAYELSLTVPHVAAIACGSLIVSQLDYRPVFILVAATCTWCMAHARRQFASRDEPLDEPPARQVRPTTRTQQPLGSSAEA